DRSSLCRCPGLCAPRWPTRRSPYMVTRCRKARRAFFCKATNSTPVRLAPPFWLSQFWTHSSQGGRPIPPPKSAGIPRKFFGWVLMPRKNLGTIRRNKPLQCGRKLGISAQYIRVLLCGADIRHAFTVQNGKHGRPCCWLQLFKTVLRRFTAEAREPRQRIRSTGNDRAEDQPVSD